MTDAVVVADLAATWRARADELERFAPPAAVALRDCAQQLEAAMRAAANDVLTLAEAALASGYSPDRLRHLIAAGELPQAGRKGAPRIRRADLPKRTQRATVTAYDPAADARALMSGGRR